MAKNDSRPSQVPLGTFSPSTPPPAPQGAADPAPTAATAPGIGAPAAATREDATEPVLPAFDEAPRAARAEPQATADTTADTHPSEHTGGQARPHFKRTLVGHPTERDSAASSPAAEPAGPVLAPPRWRGAQAYLEGQEPQPRVSSIPAAPRPSSPAAAATTAGTASTRLQSPPPPPVPGAHRASTEPLGDTLDDLLDQQGAVSMQEMRESTPEVPIDQVIDSFSEPDVEPAPAVSSRGAQAADYTEPTVLDPEPPTMTFSRPDAEEAELVDPAARALASASGADTSEAELDVEVDVEEEAAAQAVAPVSPQRPRPEPSASSLAPAEVAPEKDDSAPGLGVLMVAAIALVAVGGWWLTRTPPASEAPAPVAAAPAPEAPAPAPAPAKDEPGAAAPEQEGADTKSAQEAGRGGEAPGEDPTPEVGAPSQRGRRDARRERAAHRPRPRRAPAARITPRKPAEAPSGSATAPAQQPVLEIKPSGPLPQTPSREAVVAALEAVAPAVRACTHGQRGIAQVDLTVTDSGKVSHAVVAGDFAGTPEGTCIARAVRAARFAPFQKPLFRVVYPFSL
ncbi:MAG: hypothetical protein PVI30_13625 [Myxococcales bacterium]|jgi:hypothetical protein